MAQSYKGFETWFTGFKMAFKMHVRLSAAFLAAQCFITLYLSYHFFRGIWIGLVSYVAKSLWELRNPYGAAGIFHSLMRLTFYLFVGSGLIWSLYPLVLRFFARRAKEQRAEQHVSGAMLLSEKQVSIAVRKDKEETSLQFGSIRVPVSAETKHALIIGRPGAGKTQAVSHNLDILRKRKTKLIIYDFKGDYVGSFFDPETDIIFNPLDSRGIDWNVFSEISLITDIPAIAHSLIPQSFLADPFWNDAARAVFSGILHYLWQTNQKSNASVWDMVSSKTEVIASTLATIHEGREGHVYIQDAGSKQAMAVASVLMQYTSCFQYMGPGSSDFSISSWLHQDNPGWIFVSSYADIQDTLRPVLSLFVDILSRKLLSMADDYYRRVFIFLDEFGTLQRLSSIKNLLTLSRSKGGAVTIGVQDIGQIDRIYGPEPAPGARECLWNLGHVLGKRPGYCGVPVQKDRGYCLQLRQRDLLHGTGRAAGRRESEQGNIRKTAFLAQRYM